MIMLGSATIGLGALRGQQMGGQQGAGAESSAMAHPSGLGVIDGGRSRSRRQQHRPKAKASGSFMERFEERWRRRKNRGF